MEVSTEQCYVCGNYSTFSIAPGATLLREAICSHCTASIRYSDMARVISESLVLESLPLVEAADRLGEFAILESQSDGPIHDVLEGLPGYVCFEYLDGVRPGDFANGILCNDFQSLTFADETFDLVISQDVFEHIADPYKAFREIRRVLKAGGVHVFTVPLHEGRSSKSRNGLPAVFHGDPLRAQGALVYTDWGDDTAAIADSFGMLTTRYDLHVFHAAHEITDADLTYAEYLGTDPISYFKYNSIVFASMKL